MLIRTHRNYPFRAAAIVLLLIVSTLVLPVPTQARRSFDPGVTLEGDSSAIQLVADGTATAISAIASDINDDGASDVIVGVTGASGSAILVWRGNPALVYPNHGLANDGQQLNSIGLVRSVPIAPQLLSIRDTNSDGKVDVVATRDGVEATVILGLDDPTLEPVEVNIPASKSESSPLLVSGRFNADAIPDIVSVDRATLVPTAELSKLRAVFTVTSLADSGAGTLRQAILDANAAPGADSIEFTIVTGIAAKIILPLTPLPAITDTVAIDATTQPLFDGVPLIELSGTMLGGSADGLVLQASSSVIRGLAINDFPGRGVVVQAASIIVEGNHIGTNLAGTAIKANDGAGISIEAVGGSTVGGVTALATNVISGNGGSGIVVGGVGASSNVIQGNLIGTNRAGTIALSNGTNGVTLLVGANSTAIGGASAGSRNVISGNAIHGILVADSVSGGTIENNAIGSGPDGTGDLGNKGDGVHMVGFNNVIQGNRIASNTGDGVTVEAAATGVRITQNAMAGNGGLAIDLSDDGVTANDLNDNDNGANELQNFPVLTDATSVGGTTNVIGTLATEASSSYRIEFFASASCDPSGNGEGDIYLGFINVTTNVLGVADFQSSFAVNIAATPSVTAIAIDTAGNTSEYSACSSAATTADVSVTISGVPNPVTPGNNIVYTVTVNNSGPLPAADVMLNGSTPSGTVFTSAATTQGMLSTPPAGGVGAISCAIGTMAVNAPVTITIVVQVTGPASLTIVNTVFVSTTTPESTTANNSATTSNLVIDPPVITSISKVSGEPFRIRILGANFQIGVVVFIGADATPWPSVKMKDSATLTLKKGSTLKSRFPKGVPVTLRVVNPDGGQASMSYTR